MTTPDNTPELEYAVLEATPAPAELLPLNVRRGLYLLGLAALVAGPMVSVNLPEYGDALITGGNLLAAIALGTALANPTR